MTWRKTSVVRDFVSTPMAAWLATVALAAAAFLVTAGGALAGGITGSVTNGVTGLNGHVNLYNSSRQFVAQDGAKAPTGAYTFSDLADGSYYLTAWGFSLGSDSYGDELYNNVACFGSSCEGGPGTAVVVSGGGTTSGIDFVLELSGSIAGTISDGVNPVAGASLDVYNGAGEWLGNRGALADGTFKILNLHTGTYYLRTHNTSGFVDEVYNNVACPGRNCVITTGTPISVVAPATTSGINFVLDAGGSMSGRLTDAANGNPIANVYNAVKIYGATGTLRGSFKTDANGNYSTSWALPAGTYFAQTNTSYVDENYDNLPCLSTPCDPTAGTPILVGGSNVSGIDFALDQVSIGNAELNGSWSAPKRKGSWVRSQLTVRNDGTDAGPFSVKVYLTRKAAAAKGKLVLTKTIASLAQGAHAVIKMRVKPGATYKYAQARLDVDKAVDESNESNNTVTVSIK